MRRDRIQMRVGGAKEKTMVGRKISVQAAVKAAFDFAKINAPKTAGVLSIILFFDIAKVLAPVQDATSIDVARLALSVIEALFSVIAQGALYRLAFASEHAGDPEFRMGPLGLQWGKPETRLLGAKLLLYLLFFIAMLFLAIVLIMVLGVGMFVSGGGGTSLPSTAMASPPLNPQQASKVLLYFAPLFVAVLYVYLRVCLFGPATVAERKVLVFSTWSLTRGHVWPIFGALFLISVPVGVLNLLAGLPDEPRTATIVIGLVTCVVAFLIRPMFCGLYAYVYTALRTSAPTEAGGVPRGPWG
jgi:hypothetical protein